MKLDKKLLIIFMLGFLLGLLLGPPVHALMIWVVKMLGGHGL
jgi:hypothetical protein